MNEGKGRSRRKNFIDKTFTCKRLFIQGLSHGTLIRPYKSVFMWNLGRRHIKCHRQTAFPYITLFIHIYGIYKK